MTYFCVSIRWLDPRYHGQKADGEPEWPPSPLRLYQAMLAGACRRGDMTNGSRAALEWLQAQAPPIVVAPIAQAGQEFTRFVPNNDSDVELDRQGRLTPKNVRPTLLLGDSMIHYLWSLEEPLDHEARDYVAVLSEVAHHIAALGWGVDMAVGGGSIVSEAHAAALPGERWSPSAAASDEGLRVPVPGTLEALIHRHECIAERIAHEEVRRLNLAPSSVLSTPLRLSTFSRREYRRDSDQGGHPTAAFALRRLDDAGFSAFDTARKALTVAGMMRHAAKLAAESAGWSQEKVAAFVLGHGEVRDSVRHLPVGPCRFAYLPLPSTEVRGGASVVGSVRRGVLTAFADRCDGEIDWARRALSGQQLIDEGRKEAVALLSPLSDGDAVLARYTRPAVVWTTVTPVVLPGHDDKRQYRRRLARGTHAGKQKELLDRIAGRVDGLLRKAIRQAGFPAALAESAHLEWRRVGFLPGTGVAQRYGVPNHLKRLPRLHVKIHWRNARNEPVEVPGPICLGAGRFLGLGLFANL